MLGVHGSDIELCFAQLSGTLGSNQRWERTAEVDKVRQCAVVATRVLARQGEYLEVSWDYRACYVEWAAVQIGNPVAILGKDLTYLTGGSF